MVLLFFFFLKTLLFESFEHLITAKYGCYLIIVAFLIEVLVVIVFHVHLDFIFCLKLSEAVIVSTLMFSEPRENLICDILHMSKYSVIRVLPISDFMSTLVGVFRIF